jgi:hypothetical protein
MVLQNLEVGKVLAMIIYAWLMLWFLYGVITFFPHQLPAIVNMPP